MYKKYTFQTRNPLIRLINLLMIKNKLNMLPIMKFNFNNSKAILKNHGEII